MTEELSDLEKIMSGDWWCVVDYNITASLPFIMLRIGKKGNVVGSDYTLFTADGDEAMSLWSAFNQIRLSKVPTLKDLREMLENV